MARFAIKFLDVTFSYSYCVEVPCMLNAAHPTSCPSCLILVPSDVTVSSNLLELQSIEREYLTTHTSFHQYFLLSYVSSQLNTTLQTLQNGTRI